MIKGFKKALAILALLGSMVCGFADDWYVCMGSFDSQEDAAQRASFLEENGVPVIVSEYMKLDGSKFYRIYFYEQYETKTMAEFHKDVFLSSEATKNITGGNLWVTQVVQTRYIAADPEKRILYIKDSDSGSPIDGANVKIDEKWNVTTDQHGGAPLPNDVPDGEHTIYVTKGNDYVPTTSSFSLTGGEIRTVQQISIPKSVDYERVKIVLDWGATPYDLDSHIYSSDRHVYYSNRDSGNMNLDRDDTSSYGPETITIQNPDPHEVYRYYVYNFSDGGNDYSDRLSNSGAQITVIVNNEYKATFRVQPNQTGLWWHVFDVVNGYDIVPYDIVTNNP